MNPKQFSKNISAVKLSPIVKISELVREKAPGYRASTGQDFIYFQRGEIGFNTPEYIIEAAARALREGHTRYPKSGGEPVLKEAIIGKLARLNDAHGLRPENVFVTYGGQEALQLSFKLFEGGKGAGFSPCWSCVLENFVPYNDIEFTLIPLKSDFSVDWTQLETVLRRVDFFYFNNPQNPTGKVFSEAEVRKIAELCGRHGVYLIADEAYERVTFDGRTHFSAASLEQDFIITCFTFSKAYAMTGWRVGYVVCRDPQIIQLGRLGDYSQTAGVVTFVQHAAAYALNEAEEEARVFSEMMAIYDERRALLIKLLGKLDRITVEKPQGAFYVFPDFSALIPSAMPFEERKTYIFEHLLSHGVAVVYGACFGRHFVNNVRISFSTSNLEQIRTGVARIQLAIEALRSKACA
ncbi:MAG: aminotransferase class I/II-fold pyridoxal phosphate-dependent enzyme [Bacteroidota bacterium]